MSSFAKRTLVSIILIPLGMFAIYAGGWYLTLILLAFIAPAANEFTKLYAACGYKPSTVVVVGGVSVLLITRTLDGLYQTEFSLHAFGLFALLGMLVHLIAFERGREEAALDFAITLAGLTYIGWIGSYLIALRYLPSGAWWTFAVLTSVWLADGGAYVIGKRWGRRKISPNLSPKKTWEGYFGGILFSVGFGLLLGMAWQTGAGDTPLTPLTTALVGLVMSTLTIFGDLGESMIKRMAKAKDSGSLIPGHGGAFDRVDSWLWAGILGFYLITWLFYR